MHERRWLPNAVFTWNATVFLDLRITAGFTNIGDMQSMHEGLARGCVGEGAPLPDDWDRYLAGELPLWKVMILLDNWLGATARHCPFPRLGREERLCVCVCWDLCEWFFWSGTIYQGRKEFKWRKDAPLCFREWLKKLVLDLLQLAELLENLPFSFERGGTHILEHIINYIRVLLHNYETSDNVLLELGKIAESLIRRHKRGWETFATSRTSYRKNSFVSGTDVVPKGREPHIFDYFWMVLRAFLDANEMTAADAGIPESVELPPLKVFEDKIS